MGALLLTLALLIPAPQPDSLAQAFSPSLSDSLTRTGLLLLDESLARVDPLPREAPLFQADSLFDRVYAVKEGYWSSTEFDERNWFAMFFKQFDTGKKKPIELKLDVYRPREDTLTPRPLILFAHGGAFYVNSKGNFLPGKACEKAAQLGYVAVSMDYRMGFAANKKSIKEAQYAAQEDMRSALRYLCDSSEVFGIDTTKIVIGGSSSGAMMSMRVAFEPDSITPKLVGVVDMWGSIEDLSVLDQTQVSVIAFHGDADKTVPYGEGYPIGGKTFMDKVYGSGPIVQRLQEQGKDAVLITFEGYPHSPSFTNGTHNENFDYIAEKIIEFLRRVIPTPEESNMNFSSRN